MLRYVKSAPHIPSHPHYRSIRAGGQSEPFSSKRTWNESRSILCMYPGQYSAMLKLLHIFQTIRIFRSIRAGVQSEPFSSMGTCNQSRPLVRLHVMRAVLYSAHVSGQCCVKNAPHISICTNQGFHQEVHAHKLFDGNPHVVQMVDSALVPVGRSGAQKEGLLLLEYFKVRWRLGFARVLFSCG